jgi:hypothetical protein
MFNKLKSIQTIISVLINLVDDLGMNLRMRRPMDADAATTKTISQVSSNVSKMRMRGPIFSLTSAIVFCCSNGNVEN